MVPARRVRPGDRGRSRPPAEGTSSRTLFHDATPTRAHIDPLLKQHHLRALALVALSAGRGGRTRTAVDVLIDGETLSDGPARDGSSDRLWPRVDLPVETMRRMACGAEAIVPVIAAADETSLISGASNRIANRAQRRALRAMYRGCAIPGCRLVFNPCQIHHLHWWGRHSGHTDIEVCSGMPQAPSSSPRRRLATRARHTTQLDHRLPRRNRHDHGSTQGQGWIGAGRTSESFAQVAPAAEDLHELGHVP